MRKEVSFFITRDTFLQVIDAVYSDRPELVPFSDGDRASAVGEESAASFARHKWAEFNKSAEQRRNKQGRHRARGRLQRGYRPGGYDFKLGSKRRRITQMPKPATDLRRRAVEAERVS